MVDFSEEMLDAALAASIAMVTTLRGGEYVPAPCEVYRDVVLPRRGHAVRRRRARRFRGAACARMPVRGRAW